MPDRVEETCPTGFRVEDEALSVDGSGFRDLGSGIFTA